MVLNVIALVTVATGVASCSCDAGLGDPCGVGAGCCEEGTYCDTKGWEEEGNCATQKSQGESCCDSKECR